MPFKNPRMQAMLGIIFAFLLGTTIAQQFSDYFYDYDIDTYTAECKIVLNETLQCSSLLGFIESDNIELSKDELTELCTEECRDSLAQARKNILEACPVSTNKVEFEDGQVGTAQDRINIFLDQFSKTCLADPATENFCYDVMRSWPVAENMTTEQNCSDCFIGMLQLQLSSELSYDDEVALEFSSLTESCHKTGFEPEIPTGINTNQTSATTSPPITPTQDCISTHVVEQGDTCNGICKAYNVSTDALAQANGLPAYCRKFPSEGTKLCIPQECEIYTVQPNDTCWTIAKKFRGSFSVSQLISWNPPLNELCTNMPQQKDMQICINPPGGKGSRSSSTTTGTVPSTPAPQPTNIANGTNINCAKYHDVVKGDNCADISLRNGISLRDFFFLNPSIDQNCTNLLLGQSYCVKALGSIETYPGYTSTWTKCTTSDCYPDQSLYTTLPITKTMTYLDIDRDATQTFANQTRSRTGTPKETQTPKPLASGTFDSDKCSVYLEWANDDDEDFAKQWNSCEMIVERYKITVKDFLDWNPSLADAEPCMLGKDVRYCVHLKSDSGGTSGTIPSTEDSESTSTNQDEPTSTSSSTTAETTGTTAGEVTPTTTNSDGTATPSPIAPDTVSDCKEFYQVQDGDYCWKICNDHEISQDDFIKWNPSVKEDCSLVQKGYYYCIGV